MTIVKRKTKTGKLRYTVQIRKMIDAQWSFTGNKNIWSALFLPCQFNLQLLDWSGRIVRQGIGSISEKLPPIHERLSIDPDEWVKTMSWSNHFRRAVGTLANLKAYTEQTGRRWIHGMMSSQTLYL